MTKGRAGPRPSRALHEALGTEEGLAQIRRCDSWDAIHQRLTPTTTLHPVPMVGS